jgi:hypothetical protein
MKTRNFGNSLLAVAAVTALVLSAGNAVAQDSAVTPAQPAVASQPAPQLSYGVPQVLQLVQAKVSDGIIVSYIQNSGTIYSLTASEIVYLKQQGVSDNVLNAMLNQRSRLAGSTEPATMTASAPAASAPVASAPASSDQTYTASAPPATYVQQSAPPSTVYVVPDTQTYYYSYPYYSYYSYPYYGGYYSGWPAVSLSFGWGGYNYGGSYHGGYYGGGYRGGGGSGGGGYHGGGGSGGPPSGGHGGGGGGHR